MKISITAFFLLLSFSALAQYPYQRYDAPEYRNFYNWTFVDHWRKGDTIRHSITIPDFPSTHDSISLQLTTTKSSWDRYSTLTVQRDGVTILNVQEPMFFIPANIRLEPLRVADLNGDGRFDIKLVIPFVGDGSDQEKVRIIYLFQRQDGSYSKVSYSDLMHGHRADRDVNLDGRFEMVTKTLTTFEDQQYWTYNLYGFEGEELVNVNEYANYPIMILQQKRPNYFATKNLLPEQLKLFSAARPWEFHFAR
ncbi:MAG: hypothetical protein NWR72_08130 [Bacteroidia bacterium]|nr:hypothetical protein [Bacteroidia bacterium]